MKPIFIALFVLLALHSTAQVQKTDRSTYNLKGEVKTLVITHFLADEKFGELVKDGKFLTETHDFNKSGLIVSSKEVEHEEDEEDTEVSGKLIYDSGNRLIEMNRYEGKNELAAKYKITYNDQGLPGTAVIYTADGKVEEKNIYTYNNANLIIKQVTYNGDGKKTSEMTFEYDNSGRVSRTIDISENSKKERETRIYSYEYNSKNQAIKRTEKNKDGSIKTFTLEYDAFGNLTKEYADEETYTEYVYRYDSKNNWTQEKRTSAFLGTKVHYITERAVKYY